VLARANRLVRAADFREVVRRGRKLSTPHAVYYRMDRAPEAPLRFGFIVSKPVGHAVDRNRVTRRMRASARLLVDDGGRGADVVIRALPGAVALTTDQLGRDLVRALGTTALPVTRR